MNFQKGAANANKTKSEIKLERGKKYALPKRAVIHLIFHKYS